MPLYIVQSVDLDRCHRCLTDSLTHSLTTLKDSATQLLMKYKSGALVTQYADRLKQSKSTVPLAMFSFLLRRWLTLSSSWRTPSRRLRRW